MQQLFLQAAFSAAAFSVSLCRCLVRCLCDAVDLFAAVLRQSAVPRAEELLGLHQAGAGLHFPTVQLDIGKGAMLVFQTKCLATAALLSAAAFEMPTSQS
jgi:hypothetical protein